MLPLILQIQQDVLDNKMPITSALMKAKLACSKLGLAEFGAWVDNELNGYMDKVVTELPEYRKLHGTSEAYSPFQGWQPIIFATSKVETACSFAPVGMTISAIEASLRDTKSDGWFEFPYPTGLANKMRKAMSWGDASLRLRIPVPAVTNIVHAVRNILLEWTIKMEKEGVLGEGLAFSQSDREKSASATAQTINTFHINNVGALVQTAENSVVQGGVDSTFKLIGGVRDLLTQLDRALPGSDLPDNVQETANETLAELRAATNDPAPDIGRVRRGLGSLKRIMEEATGHLVASGAVAVIGKLLENSPSHF